MGCYQTTGVSQNHAEILTIEEFFKKPIEKFNDKSASPNFSLDSTCEQIVVPKTRKMSKDLDLSVNPLKSTNDHANQNDRILINEKAKAKLRHDHDHHCIGKTNNPSHSTTYEDELLRCYNKIRANPQSIIPKLEKIIIDNTENGSPISANYIKFRNEAIHLERGVDSIKSCIKQLKRTAPLPPLSKNVNLKIDVPEVQKWDDPQNISLLLSNKKASIDMKNKRKRIGFNIDLTLLCPIDCLLLQIIDDNGLNGLRRKNILNENFTGCFITARPIQSNGERESNSKTCLGIYSVFN